MYIPEHFQETRLEELHALIVSHPLGMIVTHGGKGLDANHIPFELEAGQGPFGTLLAHVARANPLWREVKDGDEVLVVFRAEHAYISPSWYPSKHEFHRQVPTWNYSVVHAKDRIAIRDEERFVRGVIGRLTKRHEATQPVPWKMADAEKDYLDAMVKAIVGIEVAITDLVGKVKLSQNKEARDIEGAAAMLEEQGEAALARAMRGKP